MGLLSYIARAALGASLGSVVVASCGGSEFSSSNVGASGSGGGAGTGGGSAGSSAGGSSTGGSSNVDASATGGAAGSGTDASPPAQCSIDADCDDKNVCNGKEACHDGKCLAGAGMTCPASECGTTRCDPLLGCVTVNNTNCNDKCAMLSTVCPTGQTCDPTTGLCKCPGVAIVCGAACVNTTCCPNALGGPCGRCGTWKCNSQGTSLTCTGQHGNCDPNWTCFGMCSCPDGGDCSCPTGQHRECDATCNRTACF